MTRLKKDKKYIICCRCERRFKIKLGGLKVVIPLHSAYWGIFYIELPITTCSKCYKAFHDWWISDYKKFKTKKKGASK